MKFCKTKKFICSTLKRMLITDYLITQIIYTFLLIEINFSEKKPNRWLKLIIKFLLNIHCWMLLIVLYIFLNCIHSFKYLTWSVQIKDYKNGICCFSSTRHSGVRAKSGWLRIRIMWSSGATCLPTDCCCTIKIQLRVLV